MVADALCLKVSQNRSHMGCAIIQGGGMDLGLAVQSALCKAADSAGYPIMINTQDYIYLGDRKMPVRSKHHG